MNPLKHLGIVAPLLDWYDSNRRILPWREQPTPYRVWISEIMLQQTRVEAVRPYFDRFLEALPSIEALDAASEQTVLKLWEGLGYYSRARNLKKAAHMIVEEYGGCFPQNEKDVLRLPGIGEYTAGAILSIAFGKKQPAVDGNVLRVISRLLASRENVMDAQVRRQMTEMVREILPDERVGDFNQALMELGAMICLPNGQPKCDQCPWKKMCKGKKEKIAGMLPIKPEKKQKKREKRTVFVLVCGEKVLLHKRPDQGLLASLWEFPAVSGHLDLQQAMEYGMRQGITIQEIKALGKQKHVFTHIEWLMEGYLCKTLPFEPPIGYVWASKQEIESNYSVPSAMSYFLERWQQFLNI